MDRVRVGVIGAGWVAGARHVPALQRADGAALVAVFDPVIDHARRVAPEGVLATDDLDAFYRAGLDAVHVCAPPGAHAPHTTPTTATAARGWAALRTDRHGGTNTAPQAGGGGVHA